MVSGSYGGASAKASGKEALAFLLIIIGIIIFTLWFLKRSVVEVVSTVTKPIKEAATTIAAPIAKSYANTYQEVIGGGLISVCPSNPNILLGDSRCEKLPEATNILGQDINDVGYLYYKDPQFNLPGQSLEAMKSYIETGVSPNTVLQTVGTVPGFGQVLDYSIEKAWNVGTDLGKSITGWWNS